MEGAAATAAAALIAAIIGSVIGGGAVARLLYRGHKDQLIGDLKEVFARSSQLRSTEERILGDLNAVGGRVTGAISMATMAKDTADQNADAIIRLQSSEEHRWKPMAEALDRLSRRLDESEKRAERHTALLDEISRRLDRHDGHTPRRGP